MGVQAQNKVTFRKISTGRDYVVEYAIGSSSTIHPSSGWSSIPQSPSEGLYLWQRTGYITPPETEVQEWTYFLIGYNGTDGQNSAVYKIITNADLIKKSLEGNLDRKSVV